MPERPRIGCRYALQNRCRPWAQHPEAAQRQVADYHQRKQADRGSSAEPDPMDVELPEGLRVAYTRLDHVPKSLLGDMVGDVPEELMERINTRLFMVITTQ